MYYQCDIVVKEKSRYDRYLTNYISLRKNYNNTEQQFPS